MHWQKRSKIYQKQPSGMALKSLGEKSCEIIGMESTIGTQQFQLIYCDLMLCTTPACFTTFFRSTMVPTVVENS